MRATIPRGSPIEARIQALTTPDGNGCWIWLARIDRHGYGHIKVDGSMHLAHRISFAAFRGPIPIGLTIDHLCRNTRCCNPDHMEAVSAEENVRRGKAVITTCKYGHQLSGDNIRVVNNKRYCRACDVRRHQEYRTRFRSRS